VGVLSFADVVPSPLIAGLVTGGFTILAGVLILISFFGVIKRKRGETDDYALATEDADQAAQYSPSTLILIVAIPVGALQAATFAMQMWVSTRVGEMFNDSVLSSFLSASSAQSAVGLFMTLVSAGAVLVMLVAIVVSLCAQKDFAASMIGLIFAAGGWYVACPFIFAQPRVSSVERA